MKFRNYCVVVMSATIEVGTVGIKEEIEAISESTPNILDGKGIIIATFTSAVEPTELKEWFMSNHRNFLFFELDVETSGFNITKREIHNGLFGFLKVMNANNLLEKKEQFLRDIKLSSDTKSDINISNVENEIETIKKTNKKVELFENVRITDIRKLSEIDILNMDDKLKISLSNELIDYGAKVGMENLTSIDKKILHYLAK